MGIPILILGKSGSGKTASLRNFKSNEIGIINVLGKALPFKTDLKYVVTANYDKIKSVLLNAKINTLIIDDAGYLITSEFMRKGKEKGYQKFTDLANNFYEMINFIQHQLPENRIVYLVMHEDYGDENIIKPKTIGKLLDEKICVEGLFTIVLRSMKTETGYIFKTQTDGFDVAKSPMQMFEDSQIDNDLKFVNNRIIEYYNLKGETK